MIYSFRDKWLSDFYAADKSSKSIPGDIERRLLRKLQLIDDGTCELDLRTPPGNHFKKLKGHLAGKSSIRVNDQWRLIFQWSEEKGEAWNVYLDSHKYQ